MRRAAPVRDGGELLKIDWNTGTVLARQPVWPSDPEVDDPNPRGNSRGGRGIAVIDGDVWVASYHTLHRFDRDLHPRGTLSHPLFAGLHEICLDGGNLWASCTAIDLALKVDLGGDVLASWWGREDDEIRRRFDVQPLDIDKSADNRLRFLTTVANASGHLHLNAVSMDGDRPLVLLNRVGAVVRLFPTEVVVADATMRGCHNILVHGDRIAVNDTLNKRIRIFSRGGRPLRDIDICRFPIVQAVERRFSKNRTLTDIAKRLANVRLLNPLRRRLAHSTVARPVFLRGMALTPAGTVIVGISPAMLLEVDVESGELIRSLVLSDDVRVAVHGITCVR